MASSRTYREAALEKFVRKPVSRQMVHYLSEKASSVIRCEEQLFDATSLPPTPPSTPPTDEPRIPSVEAFITELVHRSQVQVATLMSSLVYLDRLKSRLPPVAKGGKCTVHRIFLACLILAAKNLNDSSPKNKHWAKYSCCNAAGTPFGFSLTEVNLMERQLLCLLDFNLRITKDDLLECFEPFLMPIARKMHLKDQEEYELQLLEEQRLRELTRPVSPTEYPAMPSYVVQNTVPPQVPSPPSESPDLTHSRRDSDCTDITHLSIYSTGSYASKRSSVISLGSEISESSSTESDLTEPGLSSGTSSTSASSTNSPMASTPNGYSTQSGIPLSMLAGGPKSKKNKNIFMKFWQKEEEKLGRGWIPAGEHILRIDDGRGDQRDRQMSVY